MQARGLQRIKGRQVVIVTRHVRRNWQTGCCIWGAAAADPGFCVRGSVPSPPAPHLPSLILLLHPCLSLP